MEPRRPDVPGAVTISIPSSRPPPGPCPGGVLGARAAFSVSALLRDDACPGHSEGAILPIPTPRAHTGCSGTAVPPSTVQSRLQHLGR